MRKCEVRGMTKRNKKTLINNLITFGIVIVAYIFCQLSADGSLGSALKMTKSLKGQLVPICAWIVMAVSLNLVVGISGELSLGHAGFMSIGAFAGIVVSTWLKSAFAIEDGILRLVIAMIVSGVIAGIAGALIGIPVLRLRGDYLAIVTLAFGEIICNILNCVYISVDGAALHFGFLNPNIEGKLVLNGPQGAVGVEKVSTFTMGFILVIFALIVVLNLINSRSGRAIMAIRDNRIAAESMGINSTKYRMMAFVTAAVLAGMAGALYGLNYSGLAVSKFKFDQSINVLVFVVLGGIGSIRGSVIAATVLTILPEQLRAFSDYRMLVYAIVLILVMLATNNAKLKSLVSSFRLHSRQKAKLEEAVEIRQGKGGNANE